MSGFTVPFAETRGGASSPQPRSQYIIFLPKSRARHGLGQSFRAFFNATMSSSVPIDSAVLAVLESLGSEELVQCKRRAEYRGISLFEQLELQLFYDRLTPRPRLTQCHVLALHKAMLAMYPVLQVRGSANVLQWSTLACLIALCLNSGVLLLFRAPRLLAMMPLSASWTSSRSNPASMGALPAAWQQ